MDKDEFGFTLLGLRFTGHKKRLTALVLKVWLALALVLLFAVLLFDYKMTGADIPGGLISGVLLAYLIHLFTE